MGTREQQRAQLVPELARMTRTRDFRASFAKAAGPGNTLTVIPVLADDTMGYVFDRLAEAEQRAVVALCAGDEWVLAMTWPASSARVTVAEEDDSVAHIHRDSEVSMFFEYLKQHRETVVVRHIAAKLIPGNDLQMA